MPQTRTGRPLLYRSALQGHQNRGGDAGLCRSRQAVRPLAESEAGTDSAMALAMGHVMLKEFHLDREVGYFRDYVRRYTDMPMLVLLEAREGGHYAAGRLLRAADLVDGLGGKQPRVENRRYRQPQRRSGGAAGLHRLPLGREGKWNLEQREASRNRKSSCSSACWACMTTLPRWASRTSAAPTASISTAWRWTRSCCTSCR
ncbi:molybdopterin-dependent oxidoreductase [Serratia ureilytica]